MCVPYTHSVQTVWLFVTVLWASNSVKLPAQNQKRSVVYEIYILDSFESFVFMFSFSVHYLNEQTIVLNAKCTCFITHPPPSLQILPWSLF